VQIKGAFCCSQTAFSILDRIGIGENAVLVDSATVHIVLSCWASGLSLLALLVLIFVLVATFATLDVLKSLSETILDGDDLCRGLVEEVVDLGLHF